MQEIVVEIIAWAGGTGIVTAATALALSRRRGPARAGKLPSTFALARLVGSLPWRHRREARRIIAIARDHDKRHGTRHLDTFTARETLRAYLPDTIAAYLAVPAELRNRPRDGQAAADTELAHQLLILRAGLERLREIDADLGVQRMQQNKTFLHDRFGRPRESDVAPLPVLPPLLLALGERLTIFLRRS